VDLRLHILPRWNAAEAVTSLAWEEAREELHEGMSWSSVRRVGKHLRILLRFAAAKGAIRSVPEIRSPPRELIAAEAKELEPFTRKERDRLLADLRRRGNLRALRCYEVMFFNLFRKSTVERLMPSWLDLQKHTVKVPASKAKNSKTRVYWLHPRAEKAIKAQIKENEHAVHLQLSLQRLRQGRVVRNPSKHLPGMSETALKENERGHHHRHAVLAGGRMGMPRGVGRHAPPPTVDHPIFGKFDHSNAFWSACKRLGLVRTNAKGEVDRRGLTPHHVARRTAATLLVDAGVSTKDRMAAGGWESIEAAERYDLGEQVERSRRALRKLR